jgi:hypothetical protein
VDEKITVAELDKLSGVYQGVLQALVS